MTNGTINDKDFTTTAKLVVKNNKLFVKIGNARTRRMLRNLNNMDLSPYSAYIDDIEEQDYEITTTQAPQVSSAKPTQGTDDSVIAHLKNKQGADDSQ
jgi:hypothetical protein